MKLRHIIPLILLPVFLLLPATGHAQYATGAHTLGLDATLVTSPVGWGLHYEYAMDEMFGLGLSLRYFQRETFEFNENMGQTQHTVKRNTIMPMAVANFHPLAKSVWDPYLGLKLGYAIYSENDEIVGVVPPVTKPESAESGVILSLHGGLRYFFSPGISAMGALEYFAVVDDGYFDEDTSIDIQLGVSFTIR